SDSTEPSSKSAPLSVCPRMCVLISLWTCSSRSSSLSTSPSCRSCSTLITSARAATGSDICEGTCVGLSGCPCVCCGLATSDEDNAAGERNTNTDGGGKCVCGCDCAAGDRV